MAILTTGLLYGSTNINYGDFSNQKRCDVCGAESSYGFSGQLWSGTINLFACWRHTQQESQEAYDAKCGNPHRTDKFVGAGI